MPDEINVADISETVVLRSPSVIELMQSLDLSNFKIPYVLKDKILMSSGNWNDHYYSSKEIEKAYKNTDWNNRNNSDLFLDHEDKRAREWIGEVQNKRFDGTNLIGDLVVHDFNTAVKLQSGMPKVGISPKLHGLKDNETNTIVSFVFDNFSVVMNPAVKTAYINNSDGGVIMEEAGSVELKKKEEYPYPEDHAMKCAPGKKEKPEGDELSEYTDFIQDYLKKNPGASIKEGKKAWDSEKMQEKISKLADLDSTINSLKSMLSEFETKKQSLTATEQIMSEMKNEIKSLTDSVQSIKQQNNLQLKSEGMDRLGIKTDDSSTIDVSARLSEIKKDTNKAMANWFKNEFGGI